MKKATHVRKRLPRFERTLTRRRRGTTPLVILTIWFFGFRTFFSPYARFTPSLRIHGGEPIHRGE